MKTTLVSFMALLSVSVPALAQRGGETGGGQGGGRMAGPGGPGRAPGSFGGRQGGGMRLLEDLGLTEAQRTKLKALMTKQREESMALRKKHMDQLKGVLTADQRKKLEDKLKAGFGGPGGPGRGGAGPKPGGRG